MARLYPPVTEEVLSAFCLSYNDKGEKTGAVITINFNLNKAVANAEIAGVALRLRTISTNQYVVTENISINPNTDKSEGIALSYSLEEGICTFSITAANNADVINALRVGQYYKAQLAFIGLTGIVGYWSTVATIKCVAKPSVTIANYTPSDANIFVNDVLGEYIQDTSTGDSTEKVYSYRFQLFDSANNIIDDTGIQLHNSSADVSSNSSTDEYYCYQELNDSETYYIIYTVTTINGLIISSPRYQIITAESVDPEDDITLIVDTGLEEDINGAGIPDGGFPSWNPWEEGLIRIRPDLNDHVCQEVMTDTSENTVISIKNPERGITGNFIILRSSSKDNFGTWQEVRRFRLNDERPSEKIIYDYTVEQGVTYRYAIQQYNRQKFYSKKVYSYKRNPFDGAILYEKSAPILNDVTADFEDMFLYDGKRQLKVRFNPKVASFKNDLQEQKIDTIGSKHPFIFRNGNVCYKEFPISGLISFQTDNAELFMTDEDYDQMKLNRFSLDNSIRDKDYYTMYTRLDKSELIDAINNNVQLYKVVTENIDAADLNGHEDLILKRTNLASYSHFEEIKSAQEAHQYLNNGYNVYKKVSGTERYENGRPTGADTKNYTKQRTYSKTDLTSDNIMSERYFKLLVLDWLTDGKPKLFRSPTEGNYIVRLLNVSLTPKTELGRMIHEFTCTAYEIADFNYQSLVELGILTVEEPNEIEKQWYSKDITNLFVEKNKNKYTGYYAIDLDDKNINGFQCTGFAPGDQIQVMTKNSPTPLNITIGTSGSYIYDEGELIVSISILPIEDSGDFSRNILFAVEDYSNQKFDTIASINTHTEIGDQLVGPVESFLKKTVVGSGLYYSSPNVDLIFDYKQMVKQPTAQTYIPYKYYILEDGKYILCTEENYDSNKTYYEPYTDGTKLRISEILHLHAKRREIIPIFYNAYSSPTGASAIAENIYLGLEDQSPTFSLTPFGQGYIKGKSIMPSFRTQLEQNGGTSVWNTVPLVTWNSGLGNLTEEELTQARTIHDLVDFVISKCNKDIFCLFEVYMPDDLNATKWVPYSSHEFSSTSTDWGAKTYGIYDPWLYEQQTQRMNKQDQEIYKYEMGWWPKLLGPDNPYSIPVYRVKEDYGLFDPTITFYYGEQEVKISLAEKNEISLDNIKVPDSISIGNGVVCEPIYRLQYIDYTIENENVSLKNLKNNYLNVKANAETNVLKYRAGVNSRNRGALLSIKYRDLLQQLQDFENYKAVIAMLTENARTKQIEKLTQYFTKEKNLVLVAITQLQGLDRELAQLLGAPYENNSLARIDGVITQADQRYNLFFTEPNKFTTINNVSTPNIYTKEYILDNCGRSTSSAQAMATNNIFEYLYHIQNSGSNGYDFTTILDSLKANLQTTIDSIDELLDELENKIYVSQYLDLLNQKGHELLLTNPISTDLVLTKFSNINLQDTDMHPYKLINKKQNNLLSVLNNTLITSDLWNDYFHLYNTATGNDLRMLSLEKDTSDASQPLKYKVSNLEFYITVTSNMEQDPVNHYISSDCLLNSGEIISTINSALTSLNSDLTNGGDQEERQAEYESRWGAYDETIGDRYIVNYLNNIKKQLQLGYIDNNNTLGIQGTYVLEDLINTLYLTKADMSIDDIVAEIKNRSIFYSLPKSTISEYHTNLQSELESYIREYLTPVNIGTNENPNNRSPRDIYQDIVACVTYRDTHLNELSEDQKTVINNTITQLKNTSIFSNLNKTSSSSNTHWKKIGQLFTAWGNDYKKVNAGINVTEKKEDLEAYINDFNAIISYKNTLNFKFRSYVDRYNQTLLDYSVSDNIREILWEERQSYIEAQQRIEEVKSLFILQLNDCQKDVFFDGYIDFIASYVEYNNTKITENKNKYLQLLEEAQAMANATINESYSPYNQNLLVQQAWKNYLDALAALYKVEIKERFG